MTFCKLVRHYKRSENINERIVKSYATIIAPIALNMWGNSVMTTTFEYPRDPNLNVGIVYST